MRLVPVCRLMLSSPDPLQRNVYPRLLGLAWQVTRLELVCLSFRHHLSFFFLFMYSPVAGDINLVQGLGRWSSGVVSVLVSHDEVEVGSKGGQA